ncbi:single-stranded DNA-binding protein [Bordetella sp. J329]|nr:single-stranded DNA-binding protein [Bordetella sp. J329]
MAQMIGLARIGRDAELRYTAQGDAVASVSLAFNYGRKGQDGKKPTQWVDASLWGKRAEALAPYLTKGSQVTVTLDDPHIESFEGRNGPGHKLVGTITAIEFASRPESTQHANSAPPAQAQQRPATQRSDYATQSGGAATRAPAASLADMDDDIPF